MIAGLGLTLGVGSAVLVTGPVMWLKHNMAEINIIWQKSSGGVSRDGNRIPVGHQLRWR